MAAPDDLFCHLEEYSLKNVVLNRRKIGQGAYGLVEEVMVDGVVCAAKRIHPILVSTNADPEGVKRTRERFAQECSILSKLHHPHIVQFLGVYFPSVDDQRRETSEFVDYDFFSTMTLGMQGRQSTGLPWLIMEYLPYTLDHILEKRPNIPIHVKISFLLDTAKGLLYLHNKEIYHRNLTARNVLITSSIVAKIADFGEARMITKSSASNHPDLTLTPLPGNQLYMPPEADLKWSEGTVKYNNTIDIFSFGVIVLFTITQTFPCSLLATTYPDPNRRGGVLGRTEVEWREKYFDIAESSSKTDENQRLIILSQHCLQNDPNSRPKAEVIFEELMYLENTLANKMLGSSTEIWKKDKLQLMNMLEEKQKELNEKQHRMNSQFVSV